MDIYLGYVLKTLVLPPGGNFLALLFGVISRRRWPWLSRAVIWSSIISLFLLCLPAIAGFLALLGLDFTFFRQSLTPPWWMRLRLLLTAIVVLCLVVLI